jgi:hypothetical protein
MDMAKVKVGVAGYGVIGQRLADGVALQKDMELVGVADVAPTLSVRALREKGMPYAFYAAANDKLAELEQAHIPVSGTLEDLVKSVDVMLDATSAGVGAKNSEMRIVYGTLLRGVVRFFIMPSICRLTTLWAMHELPFLIAAMKSSWSSMIVEIHNQASCVRSISSYVKERKIV